MKKLIYADDISGRLERVIRIGGKAPDGEHPISAECVLSVLKSLPTVDAVEVVRCIDCKSFSHGYCRFHDAKFVRPDGYCYWGERKDGDNEKAD